MTKLHNNIPKPQKENKKENKELIENRKYKKMKIKKIHAQKKNK